jgi:protein-disulfide isomerase
LRTGKNGALARRLFWAAVAAALAAAVLASSQATGNLLWRAASADEAPKSGDNGIASKDALVDAVIERLKAHPEILVDIFLSYRERQDAEIAKSGKAAPLVNPEDPIDGNQDGDVTVVEFVDYGSAAGAATAGALDQASMADGHVRVVHKDYPVLSADSVAASARLLAFSKAGRPYLVGRQALVALKGSIGSGAADAALDRAYPASGGTEAQGRLRAADALAQTRATAAQAGVAVVPTLYVASASKLVKIEGEATRERIAAAFAEVRQ